MIKTESFESLGENYYVAVSKKHKFGTDSILLCNFAEILRKDVVADFGTGCGIISILLCKKYKPQKIYAFDILKSATDLAEKSVLKSNLKDRVLVLNEDITKLDKKYYNMFNKIVCNPPYKALNKGKISSSFENQVARHESKLTIEEVCKTAGKLLKFQGSLFLSCRVERLCEVFGVMQKYFIEPKKLQFCAKNKNSAPWLFLVEGRKNAKPFLKVLPNYFVEKGV